MVVAEEQIHSSLSLVGGFCLLVYKCKSKAAWKTDNRKQRNSIRFREINEAPLRRRCGR